MRGTVRNLLVAGAIGFAVATWVQSPAPPTRAPLPDAAASQAPGLAPITPTITAVPATLTAGCDPIEELMARMFVGLTEAALTGSGTSPEEFAAAVAADREVLERYFEVLGVPADDAAMSAFPDPGLDRQLLRACLRAPDDRLGGR